jgi:hypothetical protein
MMRSRGVGTTAHPYGHGRDGRRTINRMKRRYRMRILVCSYLFLFLAGLARAEPQVIIDTDFGAIGRAFQEIDPSKGVRITGSLPQGWGDNSNWKSNVVAEYGLAREGDRRFLRVRQSSGDGMQFTHPLPEIAKEAGYYRLSFTARSHTGLSLAVRDHGAPYRAWVTFTPATDGQWRDFSYDFRLSRARQEIGLFIYMAGNGILDLQKLRLIKLSEQDLIAEVKAKYPEAGSGNLVNASVFPLGLPSGWSIDRDYSDGDEVQVASDVKVPGPSGCSSLKIEAVRKGIRLYSAPFAVPWSFETHVLSLSLRGDWEGALIVTSGDRPCARLPLKLSSDRWQRVELPFKPVLLAPSHTMRLEGKGTLWLDGLQVEHAAQARAYAPPKPMEIALALPDSEAASARVQFADESPQIAFAVAGQTPGAVLKIRLVTMYADEKLLPPIKLDGASSGRIAYEPFVPHGLGPYRLEAWVEDAAGQRMSPYGELVFYRLRRPRYWGKDAPNSFFGAHALSTNRHLTMAKAAGVNWVRLHDAGTEYIGWAHLEPQKGQWQFRDADLQRYRAHHLKILGLLSTTPGWASNLGRPTRGYRERYLEPLGMDDWANAVRTIVRHHRGLIDTYEIWNEPWGSGFWGIKLDPQPGRDELLRGDTPAQDYARLQKVAYDAAHEVLPEVTILGFNTCDSETGTKWTKDVLDCGGIDTCDAVSYHHYETGLTGFPNDPVEMACRAVLGPILAKLGRVPKPVWMSEGAPLAGDVSNGFYRYTLPYENRNDNWRIADRLARYVITRKANREAHEFLYTMHGHSTFGGSVEWTTLVTAEGFLHPSAAAHSALAWLLEDTNFVQRVTLADGVYAYLNSGPDRAVAALTSAPAHGPYQMPAAADVRLLDLFGNPLPASAALDDQVHYVECDAGLTRLRAVLGVK